MEVILNTHNFDSILSSQRVELMKSFSEFKIENESIIIPYMDQNYECLSLLESVLESKTQAISLFSGCGGLDIGTQLAGVKVISSLDFDKDAVASLRANKFFAHTQHRHEDIRNVSASDYKDILKHNNPEKLILVGGPPCQPFSKAGYWKTLASRLGATAPASERRWTEVFHKTALEAMGFSPSGDFYLAFEIKDFTPVKGIDPQVIVSLNKGKFTAHPYFISIDKLLS